MSDADAPAPRVIPGLRPPANRLDPAVRRIWAIEMLISGVSTTVFALVAGAGLVRYAGVPVPWIAAGVAAVFAVAVVAAVVMPAIRYRHYRWEVTETGLIVQRGWLLREFIAVPHTRIQTVETRRGPLERLVDLASAGVSTAAGVAVSVPGLTAATAAELQSELSRRTGRGEGA